MELDECLALLRDGGPILEIAAAILSDRRKNDYYVAILAEMEVHPALDDTLPEVDTEELVSRFEEAISTCLRGSDWIENLREARVLAIVKCCAPKNGILIAERVLAQMHQSLTPISGIPSVVSVSIGACANSGIENVDEWLLSLENALSDSKACGGWCVRPRAWAS
jgi:GGDEF domain-containing protein